MLPKPEDYNRYSSDEKSEMLATSDTFFEGYICAWYYRRRYHLSAEVTLVLFAIVQNGGRRSTGDISAALRLSLARTRRALRTLVEIHAVHQYPLGLNKDEAIYHIRLDCCEMWTWMENDRPTSAQK